MAVLYAGSTPSNLTALPDPKLKGLTVSLQDIDSGYTTRTADGSLFRDRIVGGADAKRKLEVEWPPLYPDNMSMILQTIKDVFFYIRYPDPYTGAFRTGYFYAGDRTAPVYSADSNGNVVWDGLKVNFIEQ